MHRHPLYGHPLCPEPWVDEDDLDYWDDEYAWLDLVDDEHTREAEEIADRCVVIPIGTLADGTELTTTMDLREEIDALIADYASRHPSPEVA